MISVRTVLLALVGLAYLGVGYVATTAPHPPPVTLLIGFAPMSAAALVAAWKSRGRLWLVPLCVLGMALVLVYLNTIRAHVAWLYFIQHAGAMTLLGLTFGSTLRGRHANALCSRIAVFVNPEPLDENYLRYTWKVTLAWTLYFAVSAVLSVTLFFFAPIQAWSIFADLLTPVTVGLMFVVEYLIRRRVFPDGPRLTVMATVNAYRAFTRRTDAV